MDDQQPWMDVIKKLPAWASGTISLVIALSGFVLFLQGQRELGITILAEVVPHLTVAHVPDPAELEVLRARFTAHAAPRLPLAL